MGQLLAWVSRPSKAIRNALSGAFQRMVHLRRPTPVGSRHIRAATAWLVLGRLLSTAAMTWPLVGVLGFAASAGRGYQAAFGVMFAILFTAQSASALGYGHLYPWSVPGIYSGLAGEGKPSVGLAGFVVVVGIAGIVATVWWRDADQAG